MHTVGATVDLFCGCGGFTTGLVDAGFDVRLGIDYEPNIIDTYRRNQKHEGLQQDIGDVTSTVTSIRERVPECICLAGSPPCTEYSRCGLQHEGGIASLTQSFVDIMIQIAPHIFVMENVPDMLSSSTWTSASGVILRGGYSFVTTIVDAKYCGCPQARRRAIIVGVREDLATNEVKKQLVSLSDLVVRHARKTKATTIRDYFTHVGVSPPEYLYFPYRNKYQACVISADSTYPTMRAHEGNCLRPIPRTATSYVRRPNDAADIEAAQSITIQEGAIISTFPLDYVWPDDRRLAGIMMGNCVPPLMATWIGKAVTRHLDSVPLLEYVHRRTASHEGMWLNRPAPPKQWWRSHMSTICDPIRRAGLTLEEVGINVKPRTLSDGSASEARELTYVYGTNEIVDKAVTVTLHTPLKAGYIVRVVERMVQRSRKDDVFVLVPGHEIPFRGKTMLERHGLL